MNLKKIFLLVCSVGTAVFSAGCGDSSAAFDMNTETAFSNGFYSTYPEMHSYWNNDSLLELLDFETMQHALLCNKPNCRHQDDDCIMQRLNGIAPVFSGHSMFYFVDDESEIVLNELGNSELKIGTTLYRYDLETGSEVKIMHTDECMAAATRGGLLLHGDTLYFVGNLCARYYDENGSLIASGNAGGESHLYAVNLPNAEMQDLVRLYDVNTLAGYYPLASSSGEVVMRGLWDNKIYFDVAFVEKATEEDVVFREYVTDYDLKDGSYHGEPEDYGQIDYAAVRYASEDYQVICREGEASVFKKGEKQPVVLEDACFNQDSFLSVFDDTLFCGEKIFDLNTKVAQTMESMQNKSVVARYGDSYIISNMGMQGGFEKIPAEKLQ